MDHTYIEERGLIDLYHRGQIPPAEEVEFEEHFVACAECQERLEMARGFQRGLKTVVAEDAARAVTRAAVAAWLLRRRWLIAATLVLVMVLPTVGFLAGGRGARDAVASWKDRWESERQSASKLERLLAESERRRQEERRALEDKLAQARPPETPPAPPSPLVNTPLILLTAVRGAGEAPIIRVGKSAYISLAVDAGADPRFESYRVAITGPRAFRQAGLKPNELEAILLTFPASYFPAGSYQLELKGALPGGTVVELGVHPFRIVR